ncbi:hypothetical protein BH09GEM1_BH09GEM1_25480 [soil metagenome]
MTDVPVTPTPAPRKPSIFRWRGIIALIFAFALVVVTWLLFGDRILAASIREAASKALGAEVDLERAHLDLVGASLELRGLAIANPFDSSRNLMEVPVVRAVLDPEPLFVKRIGIRELTISRVTVDTKRGAPARRMKTEGFAQKGMRAAEQWRAQFKVPLLSLTPFDTIRALALDPSQLRTVKEAQALAAHADSAKNDIIARVQALRLRETADSAQAVVSRLKGQTPRTLGIAGTRNALGDVRRIAARVDSTKRAIDALRGLVRGAIDSLVVDAHAVDEARKADYAFARAQLRLPTFDAPSIGPALFGTVSLDAVEKTMYWVMLARQYAPPGLLPREKTGPTRLRRAGTTVQFVTPKSYPQLLLQRASLTLAVVKSAGLAGGDYSLELRDVTSDPALVGRPTQFRLTRNSVGTSADSLSVAGTIDHTGSVPREVVEVRAGRLTLPSFDVPAMPIRLELGQGASLLHFSSTGEGMKGTWRADAPAVTWHVDSVRTRSSSVLAKLVIDVITGIKAISVDADIAGTVRAPSLAVRSNLDRAVADNIKRVAGVQIAAAEAKVRARVDEEAERAMVPVRARIAAARAEGEQRLHDASEQMDKAKADLAAQLKSLSGGLLGGG